jgi:hypothetical protein
MNFVYVYENGTIEPAKLVLRGQGLRENNGGSESNQGTNVNTYVNVTVNLPVQLMYANKSVKELKQ